MNQSLIGDSSHIPGYQSITSPNPEAEAPPAAAPIRLTFWADLRRNRPQQNSMHAASCIFITAGMGIAFSMGLNFGQIGDNHMRVCWFIGAIIGGLIGLVLVERFTKRLIYFLAIGLAVVDGICFTCAPDDYSALTAGRYCAGIAFGITFPAFIVAASEESAKRFRAMIFGLAPVNITVGMLIQAVITCTPDNESDSNKAHGIVVIVCVCVALLSNLLCTIESPIYHLRKGNPSEATNVLHSLRTRLVDSNEIPDLVFEHNQLLEEDVARGMKTNLIAALRLYPKIVVLFLLMTLSFSVPIFVGLMEASLNDAVKGNNAFIYFFFFLRLIGVVIGCYALDLIGRRALIAFSLFAGGILLIVFGTMLQNKIDLLNIDKMRQAQAVIIIFQLFAGIIATGITIYLGEAFSLSVKPYFIVLSLCLGCLIQILCIYTFEADNTDTFSYIVGAVQAMFAVYFFVTTNETKGTTLREALAELNKSGINNLS